MNHNNYLSSPLRFLFLPWELASKEVNLWKYCWCCGVTGFNEKTMVTEVFFYFTLGFSEAHLDNKSGLWYRLYLLTLFC